MIILERFKKACLGSRPEDIYIYILRVKWTNVKTNYFLNSDGCFTRCVTGIKYWLGRKHTHTRIHEWNVFSKCVFSKSEPRIEKKKKKIKRFRLVVSASNTYVYVFVRTEVDRFIFRPIKSRFTASVDKNQFSLGFL